LSTKIRLMRMGKIRTPYFRIVVTDSRKARNGLSIEEIGRYVPGQEPSIIEVNSERALYWLGVGAQPSEAVEALLKVTGDWQKHKGLPGTEGTLRVAAPKPAKSVAYEAAVKAAAAEPAEGATTLKKKAQDKLAAKAAPAPVSEPEAIVEAPVEEAPVEVTELITEDTTSAGTSDTSATASGSDTTTGASSTTGFAFAASFSCAFFFKVVAPSFGSSIACLTAAS
jgi:small subunit ribosomal protein S16